MKTLIYIGIVVGLITSCKKDIEELSVFKAGDSKGNRLFYTLLDPPLNVNTILMGEMDTILYDTIFLDVNEDLIIDFTFVVEQKFTINNSKYAVQRITIETGSNVLLQLMPGIQPEFYYARTASKGEKVDVDIPWVANQVFFLTYLKYNFVEAPRFAKPYLPFMLVNGDLGWLKMGFEIDEVSYLMHSFSIDAYCLKKMY